MTRSSSRGFSLLELLVVVAILGVLSSIAIPTLINSFDRGRQKRTMADLRSIGAAIQAYVVDNDLYPSATNVVELGATLDNQYMRSMLLADAWGNGFIYSGISTGYTLGSAGKDGGSTLTLVDGGGPKRRFADDIIYANGAFVQWPEGTQAE